MEIDKACGNVKIVCKTAAHSHELKSDEYIVIDEIDYVLIDKKMRLKQPDDK